jgi:IS30 family transposase
VIPRTKNGPALAGYGAITMANALEQTITALPAELRRSLTWDRGKELSAHAQFSIASGVKVYFADPKCPGKARHQRKHEWPVTAIFSEVH